MRRAFILSKIMILSYCSIVPLNRLLLCKALIDVGPSVPNNAAVPPVASESSVEAPVRPKYTPKTFVQGEKESDSDLTLDEGRLIFFLNAIGQ